MRITLILWSILITGCATTNTKPPEGMRVAMEKDISACEFLGDVHGTSMFYGMFAGPAISKAQKEAFNNAKALGANTVVWLPVQAQYGGTSVHGNAYHCKW